MVWGLFWGFFFVNAKNSPCVLLEFILSKDLHHGIRTQFLKNVFSLHKAQK